MNWVRVSVGNERLLRHIGASLLDFEDEVELLGAQAALDHMNTVLEGLDEPYKGKIRADVKQAGKKFIISYALSGMEGRTITAPGRTTFIPESDSFSTRGSQYSKTGEPGRFYSRMGTEGRGSIEAVVMDSTRRSVAAAEEPVRARAIMSAETRLKISFSKRGIKVDERSGRYRAPAGGYRNPVTGEFTQGGQFIRGGF